jgi:hypothetical protein
MQRCAEVVGNVPQRLEGSLKKVQFTAALPGNTKSKSENYARDDAIVREKFATLAFRNRFRDFGTATSRDFTSFFS